MGKEVRVKSDGFSSKFGFIIACIGSAVGMANIWRFPYLVSEYGGLTFLLPYFLFVVLIGCSGVMEEFALGRWGGAGPVGSFGKGVREVDSLLREAGVRDLTMRLYPGARHEILNEINRREVYADILDWLSKRCGRTGTV